MLAILALGTLISAAAPPALSATDLCAVASGGDEEFRVLYEAGVSFEDFLAASTRRRDLWESNWELSAGIERELIARVEELGGEWHLLVVAVDSCSDSVNTVPFMARIADMAGNVHLRVVDPEAGAAVMAAYPTPDGRGATPTIVLLNADFEEVGCFIERPTWLRDHTLANPEELNRDQLYRWKMGWYAGDRGASTMLQTVEMLEAAAAGRPVCAANG